MRAVPFCSGTCHMFTLGRSVPAHAILPGAVAAKKTTLDGKQFGN